MDRSDILINMDNPGELEKLYRGNKTAFRTEFNSLYPELTDNKFAAFWRERLHTETSEISWGSTKELIFVIIAALTGGLIAKLPSLLSIDADFFYQRNAGFIIFPILTIYFIWKKSLSIKKTVFAGLIFLLAVIFINLLPADNESDTLILSCIHLPIFLWAVFGFTYLGDNVLNKRTRLEFLRYNGDLVIMTGLILIAGGILTGITIGLFSVIGFNIEEIYFNYIGIFGLAAAPVAGAYITQTNPQLVNRISPVIAKIFSPLVLIMLIVYLAAIIFSGKDIYNDRDFLMTFNFLLMGVMAIILFSIAASAGKSKNGPDSLILFTLSVITIIVNGIALSAIVFRISEWGVTPNRIAILGGNILMLANLFMVTYRLFQVVTKKTNIETVENAIAAFLPIYIIWTIIVTFIFPFLFSFK